MAEKKISQLTAKGSTIADTDLVVISESAGGGTYVTKSATGANIKGLVTDANLTTTDITTNDVSTLKHGFAPKAPNDATQFLDGTGAYDTVKDSDLSLSDITTNDVSTTKHGFAPKAPNDTTKFLRGDGTWATPAAGGLTKFTEAENTSAPNGTVYVDSLTAAGSTTNVDVAIVPKGTGAFLLDIPDNASTGGNKRGAGAVDLQTSRGSAGQVASGANSFAAGKNSTASGDTSIAIGNTANSSGSYSVALGSSTASNEGAFAAGASTASGQWSTATGYNNTASGTTSVCLGGGASAASGARSFSAGLSNTASGESSGCIGGGNIASGGRAMAFGSENVASGNYSVALGYQSTTNGIVSKFAFAFGTNNSYGRFVLNKTTSDTTATLLTTDGNTTSQTYNQITLPNNSGYRFKGTIIGKKSGTADVAAWDIDGIIVRGANAAATTLPLSNVTLVQNTPAWGTPTLAANTTTGCLEIKVIGAAATNIRWTAQVETTEVIYA